MGVMRVSFDDKPRFIQAPIEGNIIDGYMIENARVLISDACYAGKTREDLETVYMELMSAAWRIIKDEREHV